jgi:alpha-ketoglutarate-dependent taurine dioxygenase
VNEEATMAQPQFRDLLPAYGTEITGLDPVAALEDGDTRRVLRELFDARGVLVFRDLDVDQLTQTNLVRMLIGLEPVVDLEDGRGRRDPFYVSNKEENGGAPYGRLLFHSDMQWSEHTFQILSLYGVEVDPDASPTLFASATSGWATLPDDLRAKVAGLSALQGHDDEYTAKRVGDPDVLVTTFDKVDMRATPVGLAHPRTGATVLYVSQQMTREVVGLAPAESEALLEQLFEHLYRPENVYEHHWRHHDLVAWDNIAVQHARPNVELQGPVRTLRKVFAPLPPRNAATRPSFAKAGD